MFILLAVVAATASPLSAEHSGDEARPSPGVAANASTGAPDQGTQANDTGSTPGQTPDAKPPVQASNDKDATGVNIITGFGSVEANNYKPLTPHQRWKYYLNANFLSLGAYFSPVASSVVDQISGQPPEWGGGMEGYGRRLASRLGAGIIQGTVQSAGAWALGQEPRYIRSADQRIPHRIVHAFLYSVITYNNEGKKRPALASLGANYASSMLAMSWYPERYTALGDGVRDGNRQVIMAGVINQIQEFWPEVKKYVFRRR